MEKNWNSPRIDFALEFVDGLDLPEIRSDITFLFDIKIKLIKNKICSLYQYYEISILWQVSEISLSFWNWQF